jgi:hypothetical protein
VFASEGCLSPVSNEFPRAAAVGNRNLLLATPGKIVYVLLPTISEGFRGVAMPD